jgi:peptide deformylase
MPRKSKIVPSDLAALKIIHYPDPRLSRKSIAVGLPDESLRPLAERMFELMFAARGVGLAAPQVGVNLRLFVASPGVDPQDRRVYVNPVILSAEGWQELEEGCLSVPGVTSQVKRHNLVSIQAAGLDGKGFQEAGEGLLARIFQHEIDHLDGVLVINRMGSLARMAYRRTLKDLEDQFVGKPPPDARPCCPPGTGQTGPANP